MDQVTVGVVSGAKETPDPKSLRGVAPVSVGNATDAGVVSGLTGAAVDVLFVSPTPETPVQTSYQVKNESSDLIKITAARPTPNPSASGIDTGAQIKGPTILKSPTLPEKTQAKAIPPKANSKEK